MDQALFFQDSWLQSLLDTPDLRRTHTLRLELETLDYKIKQLLPIVDRLEKLQSKEFETHIIDGQASSTKFVLHGDRQVHNWSGPTNINGQTFRHYKGKDKLDYHVITLTWRLKFPKLPGAHVPTLRLAPRVSTKVHHDEDTIESNYHEDFGLFGPLRQRCNHAGCRWNADDSLHALDDHPDSESEFMYALWELQTCANCEAQKELEVREAMFRRDIGALKARGYERQWQAEQSLLRFA